VSPPRCHRFNTLLAALKSTTTLFSPAITRMELSRISRNCDLALRLHLLEIFSGFYGYLFSIPIRTRLAIYSYLETSTVLLLNHVPPIQSTLTAPPSPQILPTCPQVQTTPAFRGPLFSRPIFLSPTAADPTTQLNNRCRFEPDVPSVTAENRSSNEELGTRLGAPAVSACGANPVTSLSLSEMFLCSFELACSALAITGV
jgi:hypothetical protein